MPNRSKVSKRKLESILSESDITLYKSILKYNNYCEGYKDFPSVNNISELTIGKKFICGFDLPKVAISASTPVTDFVPPMHAFSIDKKPKVNYVPLRKGDIVTFSSVKIQPGVSEDATPVCLILSRTSEEICIPFMVLQMYFRDMDTFSYNDVMLNYNQPISPAFAGSTPTYKESYNKQNNPYLFILENVRHGAYLIANQSLRINDINLSPFEIKKGSKCNFVKLETNSFNPSSTSNKLIFQDSITNRMFELKPQFAKCFTLENGADKLAVQLQLTSPYDLMNQSMGIKAPSIFEELTKSKYSNILDSSFVPEPSSENNLYRKIKRAMNKVARQTGCTNDCATYEGGTLIKGTLVHTDTGTEFPYEARGENIYFRNNKNPFEYSDISAMSRYIAKECGSYYKESSNIVSKINTKNNPSDLLDTNTLEPSTVNDLLTQIKNLSSLKKSRPDQWSNYQEMKLASLQRQLSKLTKKSTY
jgi:hypothetical protein